LSGRFGRVLRRRGEKGPANLLQSARLSAISRAPGAQAPHGRGCSSGVEHDLAKVGVEGSNPFARSNFSRGVRPGHLGYVSYLRHGLQPWPEWGVDAFDLRRFAAGMARTGWAAKFGAKGSRGPAALARMLRKAQNPLHCLRLEC
jgi:hypothetical protein